MEAGEAPPDADRAELMRALHTLKGNAAMLGLRPLQELVHAVEEAFRHVGGAPPLAALHPVAAALRDAVDRAGTPEQDAALAALPPLRAALADALAAPAASGAAPAASPAPGTPSAAPSASPAEEPVEEPVETAIETSAREGGEIRTAAHGSAPAEEAESSADGVSAAAGSGREIAGGEASVAPGADAADARRETRGEDLREESVRVPFARLDTLASQVDDLARATAALRAWAAAERPRLARSGAWRPLADRMEALETAAQAVRRSAGALRLTPVGRVFSRFPALAADLARERGKRVRMVLEGEGTELDKSTADALLDPLLHLVRNAVDHGVETPEERRAAGKPETATLRLAAAQEGDRVRIEVEDDGRGLDRAAVLARARELGLVEGGDEPAEDEVDDLVFRPGFSTRRLADAVSGRGVGLDVVRAAVEALRGEVRVEDGGEGGTRFVLRVPLTVALVPVLFFRAAGETLAIPALDVEETVRAPRPGRVGTAETVELRDEALPLVRLERVFGWEPAPDPRFVLVVRRGARAGAVGADLLLAQDAAAVRALPPALGSPPGVSGAVVDAGGRVVLLIDPAEVLEMNVALYRGGDGGG